MRTKITIQRAERLNGFGEPITGWYVCDWGIPVGKPHDTREAATQTAKEYVHDVAILTFQAVR